jgi:hypothetical protein
MAQINIERKKNPVWPWVLGLILLALIAWAVYEFGYKREQRQETQRETPPPSGILIPAERYPAWT